MVVRVRFEFGDVELRAIAAHLGGAGRANHRTIETWIETVVAATLEDVLSEQDGNDEATSEGDLANRPSG